MLSRDGESCWRELEQFCVAAKDVEDVGEVDLKLAYALVEAITRQKEKYAENVLAILREKIEDFESNPKVWMEIFAVRMAGEMRLEAAIPHIIAKMEDEEEDGWLAGECESALVKIGGDATIHTVADLFRQGGWGLRMAACEVLQHVHNDLAVSVALEFLPLEEDPAIRTSLAQGLLSQFAFEAIEPVRQVALNGEYDENLADLKGDLATAATLMDVDFPERELWKEEAEKKRLKGQRKWLESQAKSMEREGKRLEERVGSLAREKRELKGQLARLRQQEYEEAEPRPKEKVGRNDPCPCGSGRKFKQCCMKKGGA